MKFRPFLIFAAVLAIGTLAHAHEFKAGDISIGHPYARPTVPNQPAGGAYVTLENKGKSTDKLIGASSPVAKSVEIHSMSMDNNVMKMREVPGIELKPSDKTVMKPGDGYHLMLIGISQPLKPGDKFPLTLSFEKAGKVEVSVWVEDKSPKDAVAAKPDSGQNAAAGHHQH